MSEDADTVKAKRFALGLSSCPCWKCKRETRVSCIVVGQGDTVSDEEDASDEDDYSTLTNIESLNPEAVSAITVAAPWMRWIESRTAGVTLWGNACEHCHALQGDHFLNSEPGGAFWPETDHDKAKIGVEWLEVPLAAQAGGMSWGVSWLK